MTSLDTNVISALLEGDDVHAQRAEDALLSASERGKLVICPPVYAELLAKPKRSSSSVDGFLQATRIEIDWILEPKIWQLAGTGFQVYASARKKHTLPEPRRILADFVIGAHAFERGLTLMTLDMRVYANCFPKLRLEEVEA